ncbi:MAG: apolipoprotein N-acyltransferase [Desulfuromonadaceae bacterium]|nr:apolipoprotein N-acyltransferase [Desulfuromonadaceae bacterium]
MIFPLSDRALALSFLSGLVLALAYPRADLSFVAWFALVPLFLVMEKRPFASGFAAGTAFFAIILYWLNIVMTTYGGMSPFFAIVAYLLLVFYLALYFAVSTWLSCRLRKLLGLSPWISLPVVWVAAEYLRAHLLSGFPWASLGYSQQRYLSMIQSADLFGVYGIGFLLVFFNASVAEGWRALRDKKASLARWAPLAAALLLLAGNAGYGWRQLRGAVDERPRSLSIALIQGNVDQAVKWDPDFKQATVDRYRRLSMDAAQAGKTDLIIWPESATPFYFDLGEPLLARVREIPPATGARLLFGAPAYEVANGSVRYLNSAFLLSRRGEVSGRSDKIHLVPFGEYNPLAKVFPFLDKLVHGVGDFSPGSLNPLSLDEAKAGVLICFEAIFPEIARNYVRLGCGLLINVTNDAWFGRSSAPYQHLAMTRFRAVENRVWIARAANTGISAFIAPSGRVTATTGIFEAATLRGETGLGARATFYNRWGDFLPLLFGVIVLVVWCGAEWRHYRQKSRTR